MLIKIIRIYSVLLIFLFAHCNTNNDPVTEPIDPTGLEACIITTSIENLEIMTWNVKEFPLDGEETITGVTNIIQKLNPDLIAFQEITTSASLNTLVSNLTGWDDQIIISSGMNLGFLFKTSEVTLEEEIIEILTGDSYAFPRPPVKIVISHTNGLSVTLLNIHLKCCGGLDNIWRRKDASEQLKEYIDSNYADEEVILLGDYNNEISETPGEENVFYNFIDDDQNYMFVDMEIALDNSTEWSYPSWPSHIDHILVTNELFDNIIQTQTLSLDSCDSQYLYDISDHRPVILQLGMD
ncbi:endonuclease/exonuclease/phosphatase family protein [Bacteroidota bacterium]